MALAAPLPTDYPRGVISVSVQNQTAGGKLVGANDSGHAVSATVGDTLRYVITIENEAKAGSPNDLVDTKLSDELPDHISYLADTDTHRLQVALGTIRPGEKVTKEYKVKLTAGKPNEIIRNEACFTGNSKAKDSPQKGCEDAYIKVAATAAPQTQKPLPNTGIDTSFIALAAIVSGVAGYIGHFMASRRHAIARSPAADR